jgi:hypothetical protein
MRKRQRGREREQQGEADCEALVFSNHASWTNDEPDEAHAVEGEAEQLSRHGGSRDS